KKCRRHYRKMSFLEVPRQEREAGEQAKQIDEDDPLVLEMKKEADRSRSGFETGEDYFVKRDRDQSGQGNAQSVVMKNSHAEEREAEQDEIDRDPEEQRDMCQSGKSGDHRNE